MFLSIRVVLFAFTVVVCAVAARADDKKLTLAPALQIKKDAQPAEDPVKATLDKARASYEAALVGARKGLLDALQTREDAARSKGDKKTVDAVKADREAFEAAGTLPKSVSVGGYETSIKQARQALATAYTEAIREYTKAKRDDKAAAVEDEMKRFASGKDTPDGKTDDTRRVWVTKSAERIEWVEGKNWLHSKPRLKESTKYVEVARTAEYIEIRRDDGQFIRIHDSIIYWGGQRDGGVRRWIENGKPDDSRGGWVK